MQANHNPQSKRSEPATQPVVATTQNLNVSTNQIVQENLKPTEGKPSLKQSFLSVVLKSDTTYSTLGSALFSTVFINSNGVSAFLFSVLPTLAFLGIGYLSLQNEYKKINDLNKDTTVTWYNPISVIKEQLKNPALFRYYRSGILAYQAVLSIMGFRPLDATMFASGTVGNYLAGKDVESSLNKEEITNKTTSTNFYSKYLIPLLRNTGFYWLVWGGLAGLRSLELKNMISSTLGGMTGTLCLASIGITAYYFYRTLRNAWNNVEVNRKKEKVFTLNCSALQLTSFGIANILSGNIILGTSITILAGSSFRLSRRILKTIGTGIAGALLIPAFTSNEKITSYEVKNSNPKQSALVLPKDWNFSENLRNFT